MKILGIYFSNKDCAAKNWDRKENEIKKEVEKWKVRDTTYKSRVGIVKTFILSKLLFLSAIYPPPESYIKIINKMCVQLVWGSNREVTKRALMYKSALDGGLGAINVGLKCIISFCKSVAAGICSRATWVGDRQKWKKQRSIARLSLPYYKLTFSDFIDRHSKLNMNWGT